MFIENEISIYDFVCTISEGVDLATPGLDRHHKMVACIAYNIAMEMNLPVDYIQNIVLAAMLHDIDVFSNEEEIRTQAVISYGNKFFRHEQFDHKLIKNFESLTNAVALIRYCHRSFGKSDTGIPMGSHIIHLADKLSVLFDERRAILEQFPEVLVKIFHEQDLFHRDAFEAFERLVTKARRRPWNINIVKDEIAALGKDFVLQ